MAQHSTAHTHPHPLLAIAMFVHTTKAAAAAPSKTGQPFKFFFQFWEIFFLSWSLSVLPGKRIFLSKTFPLLSGTGFHGCIAQSCSLTAAWTVHSKNNMSAGNQFISFKAINHSQIGFQFNPSLDIRPHITCIATAATVRKGLNSRPGLESLDGDILTEKECWLNAQDLGLSHPCIHSSNLCISELASIVSCFRKA